MIIHPSEFYIENKRKIQSLKKSIINVNLNLLI